ncbi:MAG: translocation/assembly module TamB domain-containing protein [Xenococcus sp. (in: cyanobacteria)]
MTKSTNNIPPTPEPERNNLLQQLLGILQPSRKKVIFGLTAIATTGIVGYFGVNYLVKQKLPPFVETQISNIIKRPIDLGEVKGFSLGGIEFGQTSIPPTTNDPDNISLAGVKVDFNIFPIIFRRTLPADITLIQPKIYLEQAANGEWVNLDFLQSDPNQEPQELPVKLNVGANLEDVQITLVPYQQSPIEVGVEGNARYNQNEAESVVYDLDVAIEKAQATVTGETHLETLNTETKVLVKDLALADLATLIPNSPVVLNRGFLNTDLDINIPSLEEIAAANITGFVSINDVEGEVTPLSTSVKAESQLDFTGKNLQVQQTQASFGDIVAQVAGTVNLENGYDLDVNVLPFRLSSLPTEITKQLPVAVGGEVTAAIELEGAIKEPLVTGRVENTRIINIEKTQLQKIQAEFTANLAEIVLDNLEITPVAGGKITGDGIILTKINEALASKQEIDLNKMPLEVNFSSELPTKDLVTPYYQLPPSVTVADLSATGKVTGTINDLNALVNWQIPESQTANEVAISGAGELLLENNQLQLQNTQVNLGEGIADVAAQANLNNKRWQADVRANSLSLTPFLTQFTIPNINLDRPISLDSAEIKLNGKLDELDPNKITGVADLNLDVDQGQVAVNSKLNSGIIEAITTTDNIALDPFVDLLPVSAKLDAGLINISGKLEQLLTFAEEKNLDSFELDADLDLDLDGNYITVISKLASGIVSGNVDTNAINLNRIVPSLPVAAAVRSSTTNFSGELAQLLSLQENADLSSFQADVDADAIIAGGTVNAIAQLNNNQFSTNIDANNISSNSLLNSISRRSLTSLEFDDISAQIDLSGDISPVIKNQVNIPISIDQVAVQSGAQNLKAAGNVTFSDILTNPDVADANLDVGANIDFDRLPIKELVTIASDDNQLVADSVNIQGKAEFDGEFQGKNLISAPIEPGNVSLIGDLKLVDFAFNNVKFDPVMAGQVNIVSGSEIALNLQGKQDRIIASAIPCTTADCSLPYVPTNLEFRVGEDTSQPILVTGKKNQDIFALDINNFPLTLISVAPGAALGIKGSLQGKTTGNIALNLDNFATEGQVTVKKPGVGYIQADQLTADFNYDPNSNIAEVTAASLNLGNSQYDAKTSLNLQTAEIEGELNIPEAYIQDILTSLRWFTISDVITLFDIPDYVEPTAIDPDQEIFEVNEEIAIQLEKLTQIENNIQELAAIREKNRIPTDLDIKGGFNGLITWGGTLEQPEADFKITANNWQWKPQHQFYNFIESVGLVKEESPIINIPQILIAGDLQGTVVDLEVAKLQLENTTFSAEGKLSPQDSDLNFQVADLTLENISKFIELPVDVAGEIDVTGSVTGTIDKPQIKGEVAFLDGLFNGNPLPKQFIGQFDYDSTRLQFKTSEPSFIEVSATVPYPIIPEKSDLVTAEVKLEPEAFALLDIVSNGYLNWIGGTGDADLKVEARLDLEKEIPLYDLNAKGIINLDNSQVDLITPFFSAPFQGTGEITLNNKILTVENLSGTFAEKDLTVYGSLPLLTAVNNLKKPLTVDLPVGDINIKQLYKGGVTGKISVTGAALQPVIGGEVTLEDGRVYVPKVPTTDSDVAEVAQNTTRRETTTDTSNQNPVYFIPTLDNFQVSLAELTIQDRPLYRIDLNGDLTLNGTVDDPSNIKPNGTVTIPQAWVNYLSNEFLLNRSRENTVVFTPDAGILNPYLDIQFKTVINEFDQADIRIANTGESEIRDPIAQVNYRNSITVFLTIEGETATILPFLATSNDDCDIRPDNTPLVEAKPYYIKEELNRLTKCFNVAVSKEDEETLSLSGVELTSIPYRSEGEIVSLMGNEFLAFADTLANSSQSELFDLGVSTFIINPFYRRVLYRIDDRVVRFGRKIGLDYLHLFPDLEGIYEINRNSSIRSTYNYGVPNSHEVRVEYQIRF